MGQNKMFFHELVKGNYGRKIAYADVEEVNEKNILDIVGDTLSITTKRSLIICGDIIKAISRCCIEQRPSVMM